MATMIARVMLAVATGLGACTAPPPTMPSFQTDVRPIFMAHCTRCHSENGPDGGLQGDPNSAKPSYCRLDFYEGPGDCSAPDGGLPPMSCWGAHFCATTQAVLFHARLHPVPGGSVMPPPPSPRLNDWELEESSIAGWRTRSPRARSHARSSCPLSSASGSPSGWLLAPLCFFLLRPWTAWTLASAGLGQPRPAMERDIATSRMVIERRMSGAPSLSRPTVGRQ